MDASDLALLVVLGTADANATPFEDIGPAARLIAPLDWQPTSEVIRAAVERAMRDGLVVKIAGADGVATALQTTGRGRRHAAVLLRKPIPRTSGAFLRACMRAKLGFLHLLSQPGRSAEVAALAALYEDTIDFVRQLQRLSPTLAGPALQDLRCELVRLQSEAAWLEGMTRWGPLPLAAE